ncbi:HvfX family Cu-binding RiPP maturation protein [Kangiella sediminilitoris]|uniref:DoxX n=1 Tax=Kangiella sediminilitoris TaxID=1144748 RepID=A0A1B3B854_9GAMM|nr:DoxX family protein [Kangiella sediminilitoris]AOE48936.1 DoxX [Kangiella sediminilitoris]
MTRFITDHIIPRLNSAGAFFAYLGLRLILAWEFWEAGTTKLKGNNWFSNVQDNFPFPFSMFSADTNWVLAAYGEVIFALLILFGLFTRFAALSLIIITAVATAAVHWPESWGSLSELWQGYAISNDGNGNFKLPLIFIVMALPLVFNGAGKISLDHLISKYLKQPENKTVCDIATIGAAFTVFGLTLVFVMPTTGLILIGLGLAAIIYQFFASNKPSQAD